MSGFNGGVAIVTGATSGIGRAAAVLFAQQGVKVVAAGRRVKDGYQTVQMIRSTGGEAVFFKTDVTRTAEVEAMVEQAVAAFGRLDYAFNCAGVLDVPGPLVEQPEEEWDRTMATNLKGVWLSMKYEIRQMLRQGGGGAIVNVSSIFGQIGVPGFGAYVASKHGVLGLTRVAALECAGQGIRVNAVCPGTVEATPMTDQLLAHFPASVRERLPSLYPMRRWVRAEEVAEAALWLCSRAAAYLTGHALVVDGGFTAGTLPPAQ